MDPSGVEVEPGQEAGPAHFFVVSSQRVDCSRTGSKIEAGGQRVGARFLLHLVENLQRLAVVEAALPGVPRSRTASPSR